jgi:hypothetical protein
VIAVDEHRIGFERRGATEEAVDVAAVEGAADVEAGGQVGAASSLWRWTPVTSRRRQRRSDDHRGDAERGLLERLAAGQGEALEA